MPLVPYEQRANKTNERNERRMRGAQHIHPSCGLPPATMIIAASVNNKLADFAVAISLKQKRVSFSDISTMAVMLPHQRQATYGDLEAVNRVHRCAPSL